MGFETIIALDLGKFKSVACVMDGGLCGFCSLAKTVPALGASRPTCAKIIAANRAKAVTRSDGG
jgi:hypothetical protein